MISFKKDNRKMKDDWVTPLEIVKRLGLFDLDPCAHPKQPWKLAKRSYCPPQDGLALPWRGRVWCNPPYGTGVKDWIIKMSEHGNGVILFNLTVLLRTDTAWFQSALKTASAAFIFHGRPRFYYSDGTKSGGTICGNILISWGKNNAEALKKFGVEGLLLTLKRVHGIKIN